MGARAQAGKALSGVAHALGLADAAGAEEQVVRRHRLGDKGQNRCLPARSLEAQGALSVDEGGHESTPNRGVARQTEAIRVRLGGRGEGDGGGIATGHEEDPASLGANGSIDDAIRGFPAGMEGSDHVGGVRPERGIAGVPGAEIDLRQAIHARGGSATGLDPEGIALDHHEAREAEELDGQEAEVRFAGGDVDEEAIFARASKLVEQGGDLDSLLAIFAARRGALRSDEVSLKGLLDSEGGDQNQMSQTSSSTSTAWAVIEIRSRSPPKLWI